MPNTMENYGERSYMLGYAQPNWMEKMFGEGNGGIKWGRPGMLL